MLGVVRTGGFTYVIVNSIVNKQRTRSTYAKSQTTQAENICCSFQDVSYGFLLEEEGLCSPA